MYRGRRWALVEEHLHDVLGRQAHEAGDAAGAAQHFMSMLACPHNSPYCQRLYLAQFTDALQAAQAQLVRPAVEGRPLAAVVQGVESQTQHAKRAGCASVQGPG